MGERRLVLCLPLLPPPPPPPPPACCLLRRLCVRHTPCTPRVDRSKERKELERARKMRRNKNFGLIEEVVALWEEARRHDVTPAKRSKLVAAILGKVQGHVAELAGSHSASRVIQTCAKYGTAEGTAGSRQDVGRTAKPRAPCPDAAALAAQPLLGLVAPGSPLDIQAFNSLPFSPQSAPPSCVSWSPSCWS